MPDLTDETPAAGRALLGLPLVSAAAGTLLLASLLYVVETRFAGGGARGLRLGIVCAALFISIFLLLHFSLVRTVKRLSFSTKRLAEAERKAVEALAYAQLLFRKSPIGIVTLRASGEVVSTNPAGAAMLGGTESELLALHNFLNLDSWKKSGLDELARKTLETGTPQKREFLHVTGFGKSVWLAFQFVPFEYHGEPHLLGLFADISERKVAEERLRKLSRAMEQSPVAIIITDPKGVVDYVNPKFTQVTGYTAGEVMGTIPEVLAGDPRDPKHRDMLATVQAGGEWRGELRNRRKNGELFWEAEAISPIRDAQGNPTHLLRIMEDITEKRRMEGQLLRVQRMESMGRLATGVAHDLNNILAPILMAIHLLEERAHSQEEENLFSMLREGAQRGAGIIQQLLVFGRGVEVRQAELQPRTLLKEIAKIVKETFPKDITLERMFPEDLWTVCADPTQVHQVLLNLCLNARDAMPRGGRLTLAAENVVLDDAAADGEARPGPYVVLQVADTGTGIAPEIIVNIFDPFFTTKQPGQGTGLGLSTVLGIAKAHGGFVRVRSEPGRGSQFKVYLPSPGGCKSSAAREPQNPLPDGGGKVVLVVDDEESILTVARRVLRKHGYRVFTAANGAEGILTFSQRRQEIQAVVTDMVMPFMDGPAFIRGLRQLSPEVRIIAMSGLPAQEAELLKEGAPPDAFLQKPFEANQIMLKLHELLGTISPS